MASTVAACGGDGAGRSTDPPAPVDTPATAPPTASTSPPDATVPEGFDSVTVRITDATGEVCEVCTWLADDLPTRAQGLMGVTDLGGRAGMAFAYSEPSTTSFFMFSTPTPLSIAWFGADGGFVGAADMEPCLTDDSSDCPRYAPESPFVLAIEVPRGGLDELGIGPGSTAEVVPGTRAAECAGAASS